MRWIAVLALAALTACGGEKKDATTTATSATSVTDSATHPASPGGAALVPETSAGTTVLVTLEDNRIVIVDADRIPPGPAVFTITNTGTDAHGLFIEGPGASVALADNLPKGNTVSGSATLQTGTYTLYCPLFDHRTRGEQLTLTIKPRNAPGSTSTVDPVTTGTGTGTNETSGTNATSGTR